MAESLKPASNAKTSHEIGPIPPALIQAIYHEITGKTEVLIKGLKENRLVRKEDVEQLCIKLHQIGDQFTVVGENTVVSVRHSNSLTQQHSSLTKFSQYDTTIPYPIDNITLEHSVLIKPPNAQKHHEYKIEVVIESFIVSPSDDDSEVSDFLLDLFEFHSIRVKIEYVDYLIARTFISTIEEWASGLELVETNSLMLVLRKLIPPRNSIDILRRIVMFVATCAALFTIIQLKDKVVDANQIITLANFGLISFIVYLSTVSLARTSYAIFHARLRRYVKPNLILINRGDIKNLDDFKKTKKSTVKAALVSGTGIIFAVLVNLFSNKLYELIN